jgi:hypothetical protein
LVVTKEEATGKDRRRWSSKSINFLILFYNLYI